MSVVDSAFAASPVVRRWFGVLCCAKILFLVFALVLWTGWLPVQAATERTVVVRDDRGGGVIERARLIKQYAENGTRIEIRGNYCLSACTMFIGLPNACVAPRTMFGFHGPSSPIYGISLSQSAFERWSRVMAEHYPEPLKSWFLAEGRNRTVGFFEYSGAQLIDMGITRCSG